MVIIGIVIGIFIPFTDTIVRTLVKLAIFPFVIGIGYEFIHFAGKRDNFIIRALSAPGIWVQRLTTKKPDDSQLEVAIKSLKLALPEIYGEAVEETSGETTQSGEQHDPA